MEVPILMFSPLKKIIPDTFAYFAKAWNIYFGSYLIQEQSFASFLQTEAKDIKGVKL